MAVATIGKAFRPRFEGSIPTAAPVLIRVQGGDNPMTLVGTVPAASTFVVDYTLSSWEDMDAGTATWITSGITFTANQTTAGTLGFPVNGLRATATTNPSTLQVMV